MHRETDESLNGNHPPIEITLKKGLCFREWLPLVLTRDSWIGYNLCKLDTVLYSFYTKYLSMKYETENKLYRIAEEQAGYFSLIQAKELDLHRSQIYREIKRNKFERAAWGVYRFTQFPASRFEEIHVAVLSAGKNAFVGFQTALYIYDLSDIIPDEIHLILPQTSSRRRPGICVHHANLEPDDIILWEGLKMTTVSRTIVDVARTHYDETQIDLAIQQALFRGLTTKEKLTIQAARSTKNVQQLVRSAVARVSL